MSERFRMDPEVPLNVYGAPTKEYPLGRPVVQCHTVEDADLVVRAVNDAAGKLPPMFPDTKFLTLCTLVGRRSGRVTVGESRLPVAGVLASVREVGLGEAAVMWPQLTMEELDVLEQLVVDIDAESAPDDDNGDDPQ